MHIDNDAKIRPKFVEQSLLLFQRHNLVELTNLSVAFVWHGAGVGNLPSAAENVALGFIISFKFISGANFA